MLNTIHLKKIQTHANNSIKFHNLNLKQNDSEPCDDENSVANKSYADVVKSIAQRTNAILGNQLMQNIITTKDTFDLLLMGYNFNDLLLGIVMEMKCPAFVVSTYPAVDPINYYMSNDDQLALSNRAVEENLSFMGRIASATTSVVDYAALLYLEFFGKKTVPKTESVQNESFITESILRDTSLTYLCRRFHNGSPKFVLVGGVDLHEASDFPSNVRVIFCFKFVKKKLLIKMLFLQNDVDNLLHGNNGLIYVDFGPSTKIPTRTQKTLINVFAQLPQTVIWKHSPDAWPIINHTSNIIFVDTPAHHDLLLQPNIQLFISNCDLNSVAMAKYYAVPMLTMPLNADEWTNVNSLLHEKWTIVMDSNTLTEFIIREKIQKLITNPIYVENARKSSELYCKQLEDSMRFTINLIENAPQMFSNDNQMNDITYRILLFNLKYAFGLIFTLLCVYFAVKWMQKVRFRSSYTTLA